jgi:hypothetical protein
VFSGQKRVEKQVFGQKSINLNFLATIVAEIWEKQATCHLFFFSKIKGGCLPHVQIKKKKGPVSWACPGRPAHGP